jgi:hypothetical protein
MRTLADNKKAFGPQKLVADLWTKFSARHGDGLTANGKKLQNPNKLVVAATFEMAKLSFLPNV